MSYLLPCSLLSTESTSQDCPLSMSIFMAVVWSIPIPSFYQFRLLLQRPTILRPSRIPILTRKFHFYYVSFPRTVVLSDILPLPPTIQSEKFQPMAALVAPSINVECFFIYYHILSRKKTKNPPFILLFALGESTPTKRMAFP